MKTKLSIFNITLFFLFLISVVALSAQETNIIGYECLELPFEIINPNESLHTIECVEGIAVVDTLDDPCLDFYEENGAIMKAWYFLDADFESSLEYFFDGISLKMDDTFDPQGSKFLELQKANLWIYFQSSYTNTPHRIQFRVKDLSNGGINFGISLEEGAQYFASFEALADYDFPDIQIEYSGEYLSIEGELERTFIGGDHLYLEKISIEPVIVSSIEDQEYQTMQVYPNPATEQIYIQGTFPTGSDLSIVNIHGQVLSSQVIPENKWDLDISGLDKGLYWIQVNYDHKTLHTQSFLKQ